MNQHRERAAPSSMDTISSDNNFLCVLSPLSHCSIFYVKLRRFGSYYSLINIIAWQKREEKKSENNTRLVHTCVVPSIINADSSYNLTFTYAQTHQTNTKRNETRTPN